LEFQGVSGIFILKFKIFFLWNQLELEWTEKDFFCNCLWHTILLIQILFERRILMAGSIEYQKQMTEIVYINLPGPQEPTPGMTGGELLHGFLAELYNTPSAEVKNYVTLLCAKWNVHYREQRG
jgi:hypothetical protein